MHPFHLITKHCVFLFSFDWIMNDMLEQLGKNADEFDPWISSYVSVVFRDSRAPGAGLPILSPLIETSEADNFRNLLRAFS